MTEIVQSEYSNRARLMSSWLLKYVQKTTEFQSERVKGVYQE